MSTRSIICSSMFLISLPILSIIGTQLVNFYRINTLLLILIPILAIVPALIIFDKIPKELYRLAIVIIAISLLLHTSLISNYILGADNYGEYYFANLAKSDSRWDSAIDHEYNSMLSIVILAPIISSICGISLTWVFKIIYPLLFSLVPLVLYETFRRQTGKKTAFLASFFFMSVFTFFTEINTIAKQQIGEIFFVLILLLIVSKNIAPRKSSLLLIIFAISMAVSHYALTYIFMWFLILGIAISFFLKKALSGKFLGRIFATDITHVGYRWRDGAFSNILILILFSFASSWYISVSNSASFNRIVMVSIQTGQSVFTSLLNSYVPRGLSLLIGQTVSPIHEITKIVHILTQAFIAIGILGLLISKGKNRFDHKYAYLSFASFTFCLAAIVVPYLASFLNTTRLYHITLLIIAPFCILGGISLFRYLSGLFYRILKRRNRMSELTALKFMSILLGVFLLFNTGFMYEITKSHQLSIALSQNAILEYGNAVMKIDLYTVITLDEEVASANWLSNYKDKTMKTYSDFTTLRVLNAYAMIPREYEQAIDNATERLDGRSYVYMEMLNVVEGIMAGKQKTGHSDMFNATRIRFQLSQKANSIYSNGGSEIYFTISPVYLDPHT